MITTRLTELLKLRFPIISAPMVGMSGGDLAGAVSAAGGLGTFGGVGAPGWSLTLDYVTDNIARARQHSNGPIGVGFITQYIADSQANFDMALNEDVPVMLLSFADPRPWLSRIKASGKIAICQVQSLEAARVAVEEGADVLAVQGNEAGGHTGALNLLPALAQALDAFPATPVVAAGGIANGRSLAAVLAAGADGAWIGTGFRTVRECQEISEPERAAILASDGRDTIWSGVYDKVSHAAFDNPPWPDGIAMRAKANAFIRRWHGQEEALATEIGQDQASYQTIYDDPAAANYPHLFGEAAGFVTETETAEGFMTRICAEAEALLRQAAALS
jgi:nitronate monooxygenase